MTTICSDYFHTHVVLSEPLAFVYTMCGPQSMNVHKTLARLPIFTHKYRGSHMSGYLL